VLQAEFFREVFLLSDRGLDLVLMLIQIIYPDHSIHFLPRIVKFLISYFTSGAKYFLQVGQVSILLVLRSMRQFWQKVCPHCRILGILSLSL